MYLAEEVCANFGCGLEAGCEALSNKMWTKGAEPVSETNEIVPSCTSSNPLSVTSQLLAFQKVKAKTGLTFPEEKSGV